MDEPRNKTLQSLIGTEAAHADDWEAVACQWDGTTGLPRAWDHLVVHDRARW
jgi:hypothetical protein